MGYSSDEAKISRPRPQSQGAKAFSLSIMATVDISAVLYADGIGNELSFDCVFV